MSPAINSSFISQDTTPSPLCLQEKQGSFPSTVMVAWPKGILPVLNYHLTKDNLPFQ